MDHAESSFSEFILRLASHEMRRALRSSANEGLSDAASIELYMGTHSVRKQSLNDIVSQFVHLLQSTCFQGDPEHHGHSKIFRTPTATACNFFTHVIFQGWRLGP